MTEDEKYTDISEKLKRLPKLKASDGFMSKLESRIAEAESERTYVTKKHYEKEKEGILDKISMWIKNPWLAPAMGILIFAFIALYVTQFNRHETFIETKQESIQQDKNPGMQNPEVNKKPEEKPSDINPSSMESNTVKENSNLRQYPKKQTGTELNPPSASEPETNNFKKTEISTEAPSPVIEEKSSFIKKEDTGGGLDKDNPVKNKNADEEVNSGVMKSKTTVPEKTTDEQTGRSTMDALEKSDEPLKMNVREKLKVLNKKNLDSLKKKIDKK